MNTRRLLVPLLILALPLTAAADTLVLKNGGKLEGKLLAKKGDKIHFQTHHGEAIFDASQVKEVVTGKTVVDEYKARFKKIVFTDAKGHYELGKWCRQQGMVGEWRDQLKLVLRIEPEHKAARKDIGHIKHGEKWLTSPEQIEKAGYTRYLGNWYTREALAKLDVSPAKQKAHEKLRVTINKLLKTMSGKNDRKRSQARDELLVLARVQRMPDLAQLAGSLYKRYNEYHNHMRYVTLEVRTQLAEVKQPIDTVISTIASGQSGDLTDPDNDTSSNPAAITIDVPQVKLIDIATTVMVPGGNGMR